MRDDTDTEAKKPKPKTSRPWPGHEAFRERHAGKREGSWWRNPTGASVRFLIFVGPPTPTWNGHYAVEITPGAVVELPREWDSAIHDVDDRGLVSAGHAPQLVRASPPGSSEPDPEPTPVHPSLQPNKRVRRRAP